MATARAMVYSAYGNPNDELKCITHNLDRPGDDQVLLQLLACPINPSDIHQVEGVYPSRPEFKSQFGSEIPVAVGGNEGLFKVVEIGKNVSNFKVGDWALPRVNLFGTWRTHALCEAKQLNRLPPNKISPVVGATIAINPVTAWNILHEFTELKPGDWFIQNGGTSAVGRAAIQIAKLKGFKSINVIRDRPDFDKVKQELMDLGATHVITEEQSSDKSFNSTIKEWVGNSEVKLALNCIGGKSCTNIVRKLSYGAHLVTYGAMSKQPVTLDTADIVFNDTHSHGYWLSGWARKFPDKRYELILDLLDLIAEGSLKDIPSVNHDWKNDDTFEKVFKEAMENSINSKGKQILVYQE